MRVTIWGSTLNLYHHVPTIRISRAYGGRFREQTAIRYSGPKGTLHVPFDLFFFGMPWDGL